MPKETLVSHSQSLHWLCELQVASVPEAVQEGPGRSS
ncbi:hypothetical protein SLEP1_g57214 [Rubroshorea leprosula]|uniref:Uncharacterized protein n=1 Tax=Rubroshorea leprosula TaxID=152421 RepID=A0AAV5MKJ7_9ROSI|nr:hypothetical protein SLEP1_g57214 [Rubroshorea leprosula]